MSFTCQSYKSPEHHAFALLSSTGIGDIIPLTPHAHAVASVEMFVGLLYLAGVVARLIGLTMQSRHDDAPRS